MFGSTIKIKMPIVLLFFIATSLNVNAARPMTENDLGNVSAITGENILNLFGAPAAGLTIDQAEAYSSNLTNLTNTNTYNEGDSTVTFAASELKLIEENSVSQNIGIEIQDIDISVFEEAISATKRTIGVAESLNVSNSEIRYLDKDMHHDLTILSSNNVKIVRDLQIDLLKIEELKTSANGPSAGSIYLSDWRSQGSTTMVTR